MFLLRLQLIIIFYLFTLTACANAQDIDYPRHVGLPLYFVTDRNMTASDEESETFGDDRGLFSLGRARVVIDTVNRSDAAGFADPYRWPAYNDGSRGDSIDLVQVLAENQFYPDLLQSEEEDSTVVVYIHGYSKSFADAVLDAADMQYELNLQHPLILYTWPSAGSKVSYASDQVNIDWSTPHLIEFLLSLINRDDIDRIKLVAHSMGNRGLLNALTYLAASGQLPGVAEVDQVVLLAPDVDAEIFGRDYLPVLLNITDNLTLYANSKDVPLQTSNRVNRYTRLGDSREQVYVAEQLDTIDISDVVSFFSSHNAHLEIPEVQKDLYYLLNQGLSAENRPALIEQFDEQQRSYWKLPSQD